MSGAIALTCALEAAALAVPWALGDRIAIWAATLRPLGSIGFGGYVAGWFAITAIVVLPAAFISGVLGRKPVSRTGNALLAKRASAAPAACA